MTRKDKDLLRALRQLAAPGVAAVPAGEGGWCLSGGSGAAARRDRAVAPPVAARAVAGGLAELAEGRVRLTAAGRAALRRMLSGTEDFQAQHQERVPATLDGEAGREEVTVNLLESPLAQLRWRKGRDGRPLIDAVAFEAGERLRADVTRGQLMPRVTANWGASVASGGRAGGVAELTEASLAARLRVERALAAVGPDFAGLLLDFCCFLKGIETIERERGWPARSAKLVLQLALSALARHYGLGGEARGAESGHTRHWGSEDYRPKIA